MLSCTPIPDKTRIHTRARIRNRKGAKTSISKSLKILIFCPDKHWTDRMLYKNRNPFVLQAELTVGHFIEQVGDIKNFTNSLLKCSYNWPKIIQKSKEHQPKQTQKTCAIKNLQRINRKIAISNSQKTCFGIPAFTFDEERKTDIQRERDGLPYFCSVKICRRDGEFW